MNKKDKDDASYLSGFAVGVPAATILTLSTMSPTIASAPIKSFLAIGSLALGGLGVHFATKVKAEDSTNYSAHALLKGGAVGAIVGIQMMKAAAFVEPVPMATPEPASASVCVMPLDGPPPITLGCIPS